MESVTIKQIQKQITKMAITKKGLIYKSNYKRLSEFVKYFKLMNYNYEQILVVLQPLTIDQLYEVCTKYLLLKY